MLLKKFSFSIYFFIFFITFLCYESIAKDEKSSENKYGKFEFNGYVDLYFAYDFNEPYNKVDLYSSNPLKVNEFGLSYAFLSSTYTFHKLKAKFALNVGNIVEKMYELEEPLIKLIREASINYEFTKWFSAEFGITPALFGFETFVNKSNLHATRAVFTDFAPDYAAGLTLSFKLSNLWTYKFQVNNGWQVIRETNNNKGLASVFIYEKPEKSMVNMGFFYVDEEPDTAKSRPRFYFNNFAKFHLGTRWIVAPMFDFGIQKKEKTDEYDYWYSVGMSVRYQINKYLGVAGRYERMIDPHRIIPEVKTNPETPHNFQMDGGTLTFECIPNSYFTIRLEGRYKYNIDPIFLRGKEYSNDEFFIYSSLAVSF